MSLTLEDKVDYLFKQSQSKSRGANELAFYEENIPTALEVHADAVFAEPLPKPAPAASTDIVKKFFPANEGGEGWITMTMDRAVNGGRKWVALDTFESVWSSGSGDVSRVMSNFVSNSYDKTYIVKVFDGNDNRIAELDASAWLFNYRAGVLTFETNRPEGGTSESDCIKIKVYQYTGKMQSDVLGGAAAVSRVRAELVGDKNDVNLDFYLPDDVDTSDASSYGIEFNGHEIYEGDDFTVDAIDPRLIHMGESLESFDQLHVLYFPKVDA